MALAQIIHGTGDELIAYLDKHRNKTNLTLIIPEDEKIPVAPRPYPENAVIRNGVPLFPTEGRSEVVTLEQVRQLMEEEE